MRKISMRNSLKDIENVNFDYAIPQSAQQYSYEGKVDSNTHSIQNSMNKSTKKILKTSIQKVTLLGPASTLNFQHETNKKINEKLDFYQKVPEGRSNELLMFKPKNATQKLLKRKNRTELKQTVTSQKISNLRRTFISKLKRNNIYSQPIDYKIQTQSCCKIHAMRGVQLSETASNVLITVFIINYIAMLFIASITIVINELREDSFVKIVEITSIAINFLEILLNFVTIRFSLGRKLETLEEITKDYAKECLAIDLLSFIVILLSSLTDSNFKFLNLCKVCILFKLPHWFEKIKKLQVYFIENYYKEQYWSLVKVFLFNFLYAHVLSVVLLSMPNVNQTHNWLITRGLQDALWYEKYVWSYYWSTTTMLTIGFGDITPSCYQEALVMIFIETISCVILAYNINCVGTLISNIRLQDEQKHKDLKVFKKLVQKNKVSEQLSWKINNFIQEHSNIKKLTNIDQEVKFVERLPSNYKVQYLKESNKSIFKGVYFFNNLMEKTLCALAESIRARITHPLEVLLSNDNHLDLLILKDGQIACKSNKIGNCSYSGQLVNKLRVNTQDRPFLLHTNFITKQRSNYKIISTVYSLLYYLNFDKLLLTLREFNVDFQLYCQLKDKCKYHIDQFEVFYCKSCKIRHTQFDCPKYHFIPIREHVVHRYLAVQKNTKNCRQKPFERAKMYNESIDSKFQVYFRMLAQTGSLKTFNKLRQSRKKDSLTKNNQKLISHILRKRKRSKANSQSQYSNQMVSYRKIQQKITQALKVHLGRILGEQNYGDEVWLIQTDKMINYKMYFGKDNPQNLESKFSLSKRKLTYEGTTVDWSEFASNSVHSRTYKNKEGKSQSEVAMPFLSVVMSSFD